MYCTKRQNALWLVHSNFLRVPQLFLAAGQKAAWQVCHCNSLKTVYKPIVRGIFPLSTCNAASSSTPPPPPSAQQGRSQDAYQEDLIKLTIADLSFYYGVVKRQIILYQHPLTGLYPETSRDKEGAMHK